MLALVLALSLATVAFGAGFSGDTHADALTAAADGSVVTEVKQQTEARSIVGVGGAVTYYPATFLLTYTKTVNGVVTMTGTANAIELATSDEADIVYVEGTTVRYFSTNTALTSDLKLAKTTVITDATKAACGDVLANSADTVFVDANDTYYVAGLVWDVTHDAQYGYIDGKLVYVSVAAADARTVANCDANGDGKLAAGHVRDIVHTFKFDKAVTKVNGISSTTYTKLYCTECGQEFNFVYKVKTNEADAEAAAKLAGQTKFGVGNFKVVVLQDGTDYVGFAYEKTASAAGTTTTGVSSAKTFDAGVALYAGMALMSVAGSAVVIGKKKEF